MIGVNRARTTPNAYTTISNSGSLVHHNEKRINLKVSPNTDKKSKDPITEEEDEDDNEEENDNSDQPLGKRFTESMKREKRIEKKEYNNTDDLRNEESQITTSENDDIEMSIELDTIKEVDIIQSSQTIISSSSSSSSSSHKRKQQEDQEEERKTKNSRGIGLKKKASLKGKEKDEEEEEDAEIKDTRKDLSEFYREYEEAERDLKENDVLYDLLGLFNSGTARTTPGMGTEYDKAIRYINNLYEREITKLENGDARQKRFQKEQMTAYEYVKGRSIMMRGIRVSGIGNCRVKTIVVNYLIGNYKINTDYQRIPYMWNRKMQNEFLNTAIIMSFGIPTIHLHIDDSWSDDEQKYFRYIIDGRHKIETLANFVMGRLKWCYRGPNGKPYSIFIWQLSETDRDSIFDKIWAIAEYTCTSEQAKIVFNQLNKQKGLTTSQILWASIHSIPSLLKSNPELLESFLDVINKSCVLGAEKPSFSIKNIRNQDATKAQSGLFLVAVHMAILSVCTNASSIASTEKVNSFLDANPNLNEEEEEHMIKCCRTFIAAFTSHPCNLNSASEAYTVFRFMSGKIGEFENQPERLSIWYKSCVADHRAKIIKKGNNAVVPSDDAFKIDAKSGNKAVVKHSTLNPSPEVRKYFENVGGCNSNDTKKFTERLNCIQKIWMRFCKSEKKEKLLSLTNKKGRKN